MLGIILIIGVLLLVVLAYMQHPKFGKFPSGERLERIEKSPNFKNGQFQNIHNTPQLSEGYGYWGVMKEFLFGKSEDSKPKIALPYKKVDLKNLAPNQNLLVWFGHSSYFMQLDGKTFLVDPVLDGNASPIPGGTKPYPGTNNYKTEDLPEIDYLFISHDHYDHLSYETIKKLRNKVKKVICGLGVGAHFEHWKYPKKNILEFDWNTTYTLENGFEIVTTPARHFSGRTFKRNKSLWLSFVLKTPSLKLFLGGDSGYDDHFKIIGKNHGPFDLAILENGQYNKAWKYIHMQPEEVLQAAKELRAKQLFPVHSSKFTLANHAWYEPLERISNLAEKQNYPIVTPIIGELVFLSNSEQKFTKWWQIK